MKLLNNPWVVGLLVVVALVVVGYQSFHPRWQHRVAGASHAPGPVTEIHHLPVTENRPPLSAAASQPARTPVSPVDSSYAQAHLAAWINAPQRDPFWQAPKTTSSSAPLPHWKLKAIWRQQGVTMAAINQGVYQLGDLLDGYIITLINDNEVWLEKDGQKAFLGFGNPEPAKAAAPK